MSVPGTTRTRDRGRLAALWFALLGGMSAFAAHLLVVFYLVPVSCAVGSRWLVVVPTAILGAVALAAAVTGWRLRGVESAGPDWPGAPGTRGDRARFMAGAGAFLSGLALLIIVYGGISLVVFDPCLPNRAV